MSVSQTCESQLRLHSFSLDGEFRCSSSVRTHSLVILLVLPLTCVFTTQSKPLRGLSQRDGPPARAKDLRLEADECSHFIIRSPQRHASVGFGMSSARPGAPLRERYLYLTLIYHCG